MSQIGIEHVDPSVLKPAPYNPRTMGAAERKRLERGIKEFGLVDPIIARRSDHMVIGGHQRLAAAHALGLATVPVVYLDDIADDKAAALNVLLNNPSAQGQWDLPKLTDILSELDGNGFDATLTGFDDEELRRMLAPAGGLLDGVDPDEVPEPPAEPITRPGDLITLGRHRIICGDCRDFTTVERLLDGQRVNVALTSPPYASQRTYDESSGFRPIPPDEYVMWFRDVAANVMANIADDGSWFVNIKPPADGLDTHLYVLDLVIAHVREWGWHFATEFCWERNGVPKSVTQRFKNQFEPIYQFARGRWKMRPDAVRHESENVPRAGGKGSGDTGWRDAQGGRGSRSVPGSFGAAKKRRNGTSDIKSDVQGTNYDVGEYIGPGLAYPGNRLPPMAASHEATGHTAAFPVGLPSFFIRAFSDEGDVIFDPFMGSGSTLIAAEKEGRVAYGCEISPAYCDVIVSRWEKATGQTAVRPSHG